MNSYVVVPLSVGGYAVKIPVVVTEDNVDRTLVTARHLMDDKRRAEIAATDQFVSRLDDTQSRGQLPNIVVDIGQDRETHADQ